MIMKEENNNNVSDKMIDDNNLTIKENNNSDEMNNNISDYKVNNETNNSKINNQEKTDEKNLIPIAINIDDNYIYPAIVFLTSLLENKRKSTKYDIHVLISEKIATESKTKLFSLINKYGKENLNISIDNIKVDFSKGYSDTHVSKAAYSRISIPSLFPNIDKIIYSDCDIINFEDLTELYNLDFGEKIYYRGFLDYQSLTKTLKTYGINTPKYMNSGVLLINSKEIRKDGIEQKIIDFVNTHSKLPHYDQTAINAICYNNFDKLPIKYCTFNFRDYAKVQRYNNEQDKRYRYSEQEIYESFHSPVMLHYAGYEKPWIKNKQCFFREYWWYYAKKTDYYEEILKKYGFTNFDVTKLLTEIAKHSYIRNNK